MAPDPVKMAAYNLPDPSHIQDREPWEKQHFPDLQVVHASFEDTNLWIAEQIKRRNRHARRHNIINSLKLNHTRQLLTTAPLPQGRPFNWLLESFHVPEEYQAEHLRDQAPWFVRVRFMLIDLPSQLRDAGGVKGWRGYKMKRSGSGIRSVMPNRPRDITHGRRTVFSIWERNEDGDRVLTGEWFVAAYVWGQSRAWMESADVRNLISFSNAYCIRAFERKPCPQWKYGQKWEMFYDLERHGGEPTTRLLLEEPIGSAGASVPVAFGAPIPERLATLCGVIDDEARRLLQGSHESFKCAGGGEEKFRAHLFE